MNIHFQLIWSDDPDEIIKFRCSECQQIIHDTDKHAAVHGAGRYTVNTIPKREI